MSRCNTALDDEYHALTSTTILSSTKKEPFRSVIIEPYTFCSRCQDWKLKFTNLELSVKEMKSYHKSLTEDLEQSINLLLNDYIKDSDSSKQF